MLTLARMFLQNISTAHTAVIRSLTVLLPALLLLSCDQVDYSTEPSYQALENFMESKDLYEKFDIQEVKVNHLTTQDSAVYGANNELISRGVKAVYSLKIKSTGKQYSSTAEVVSSDSLSWKVKKFTLTNHKNSGQTNIETFIIK